MSAIEQKVSSDALLSREEVNGLNPAFERESHEFYAAEIYEIEIPAGYDMKDYRYGTRIEGHGKALNIDTLSYDDEDADSATFIKQVTAPQTLSVDALSETSDTGLVLASQLNAESALRQFGEAYNRIAGYEVEPQSEVTEYHAHIIGVRGLIRNNASRELTAIGSLLNSSIADLQNTRPWVVARHNTLGYGHAIAAQLLEFEVSEANAKTRLRPVVMTVDHRRGYLPSHYRLVDDWLYFENSGDGKAA